MAASALEQVVRRDKVGGVQVEHSVVRARTLVGEDCVWLAEPRTHPCSWDGSRR